MARWYAGFGFSIAYLLFFAKYMVLDLFGKEIQATVIGRQDRYMRRATINPFSLVMAIIGRHRLTYRFNVDGKAYLSTMRVSHFIFENTPLHEKQMLLYLPQCPSLHCMRDLLPVRFREMIAIGAVAMTIMFLRFGPAFFTGDSSHSPAAAAEHWHGMSDLETNPSYEKLSPEQKEEVKRQFERIRHPQEGGARE